MDVRFPQLLVVDDDRYILRYLQMNLERDGFEVSLASSAKEALDHLGRRLPDLAVVDLLLPDMHGFELCRRIKNYLDLPILIMSAVGKEETVVEGLDLYAEDYVVKPIRYRELLARVNRVIKRTCDLLPNSHICGLDARVSLDFARRLAVVDGLEVSLTPTESRLLSCLARTPNRIIADHKLMDEVWPEGEGDPQRLKVAIHRLRQKLETDPCDPRYLVTQRGRGHSLQTSV
ncbi:MAG: response regulator transcription factor [Dehalococcoidia bacterium]|nr:response regulator transcription factor [Dehalococcoidia bacterium]